MTTTTSTSSAPARFDGLAAALRGDLIRPDDPRNDEARAVYNAMIDRRPSALISQTRS